VERIEGDPKVSGVLIRNVKDDTTQVLPCSGVFIYIGFFPNTDYLKGSPILDEYGYVITKPDMSTAIPAFLRRGCTHHSPETDRLGSG